MDSDISKLGLIRAVGITGIFGYLKYKVRATIRTPDMDKVTDGLWIGGETKNVPSDFKVINVRDLQEANYIIPYELIRKSLEVAKEINEGNKVFVHCRHGRGRAPLVAMAYLLLKNFDFTVEDAYDLVRYSRPNLAINEKQMKSLNEIYELMHG